MRGLRRSFRGGDRTDIPAISAVMQEAVVALLALEGGWGGRATFVDRVGGSPGPRALLVRAAV